MECAQLSGCSAMQEILWYIRRMNVMMFPAIRFNHSANGQIFARWVEVLSGEVVRYRYCSLSE